MTAHAPVLDEADQILDVTIVDDDVLVEEIIVEEVSIDGVCGVY